MSVDTENKKVGICHICSINVYDRGKLNKPFTFAGKIRMGYPNDASMPCGINREVIPGKKLTEPEIAANKELTNLQKDRCPFETKEEQDLIEYRKGKGIFSGQNTWDAIV